jgi:hypothetical protein
MSCAIDDRSDKVEHERALEHKSADEVATKDAADAAESDEEEEAEEAASARRNIFSLRRDGSSVRKFRVKERRK